ncbi:hypothetical protein SLA2020_046230 [Shorea laevis]
MITSLPRRTLPVCVMRTRIRPGILAEISHIDALPDQLVRQAHPEELDPTVGACLGVVAVVAAMRAAPRHFWVQAPQIEEGAEG